MVIDWSAVEADYITGNLSYRKIAQKYNIDFSTIKNRGKLDRWVEKRKEYRNSLTTKIVQNATRAELKLIDKVYSVADKLLCVMDKAADKMLQSEEAIHPALIKPLTAALKDIKDIQNRPTDADMREQEARIRALEAKVPDAENEELGIIVMPQIEEVSDDEE